METVVLMAYWVPGDIAVVAVDAVAVRLEQGRVS